LENFLQRQLVNEKLDRVIFGEDYVKLFPNYLVTNGPFTCSYHDFVLFNANPAHVPRRGTNFRYQHSWVHYQGTHSVMKKTWQSRVHGAPMYRVIQKLKKIKLDLKWWSKATFGNFKSKLERNCEKLLVVETKLVQDLNNVPLNNWHLSKEKRCICSIKNIGEDWQGKNGLSMVIGIPLFPPDDEGKKD